MSPSALDELRLRRLIDVGRGLIAELDVEAVLTQLLDVAREITGARYAAVGVLDNRREELARFITAGIDPDTHRAIGDPPRGRGILGLLIEEPRPLRLEHIGDHPRSYGFPVAGATRIQIDVTEHDGCVDVAVSDDGGGFDPEQANSGGLGLTGMRERVELAGGELDIDSGASGTTVKARLPVRRRAVA